MKLEDGDTVKIEQEKAMMSENDITNMPEWMDPLEYSNVVKMDHANPPKKSTPVPKVKKGSNPKIPLPQIQYALLEWMAGSRELTGAPAFTDRFRSAEIDRSKGAYSLLEVDKDNLATEVDKRALVDAVLADMKKFKGEALEYCLSIERLKGLAEIFIETNHQRRIPLPPIFTFEKDKNRIAFNRVPNPNKDLRCFHGTKEFLHFAPIYSDFIDRCSESLAVRQFFGSLLHPEYHGKTSLHLWGDSNAGKSTFIELFLQTLCGKRGYEPVDFDYTDSFRLDGWSGKLALYADEVNDRYYATPEYKRITNSTEQRVNVKNKAAHKQLITAKLIATTNHCPALPPDNAVNNRIVLSKVEALKEMNNNLGQLTAALRAEMPFILADVEWAFSLLRGKPIRVSAACHEESQSIYAAPFQELFDRFFVADENGKVTVAEFKEIIVRKGEGKITYQQMREFVRQKYFSDLNYRSNAVVYVTKIKRKLGVIY